MSPHLPSPHFFLSYEKVRMTVNINIYIYALLYANSANEFLLLAADKYAWQPEIVKVQVIEQKAVWGAAKKTHLKKRESA